MLHRSLSDAMKARKPDTKRPIVQTHTRRITYSLPPYQQDQRPNSSWPMPGRGVSGETSN